MDEVQLVKEIRSDIASVEGAEVSRARQRLQRAIDAEVAQEMLRDQRGSRPRSTRFRWAAGWTTAAATVFALIIVFTVGPSPRLPSHAAAVEALSAAADAAATIPPWSEDGKYIYSKSRSTNFVAAANFDVSTDPYFVLVRQTREIWKARDGSGFILTVGEAAEFPTEGDRQAWIAAGRPDFGPGVSHESFGPGELSRVDLNGLPTETDELYALLSHRAQGAATTHDWAMLISVGELLRETAAPVELRRALYEVAARIPSIEMVGETTDSLGRQGTVVAVEAEESGVRRRLEMVFDEETSELLAQREVFLERDAQLENDPPTTVSETTFIAAGRTDSIPEQVGESQS